MWFALQSKTKAIVIPRGQSQIVKEQAPDLHKYQHSIHNCQQIEVLAVFYAKETGAQEIKRLVEDHMKA